MEHELIINLLAWREKKLRRRKLWRGFLVCVIVISTASALFLIYKNEEKKEHSAAVKTENPLFKKAFQAKQEWGLLTKLFNVVSTKLPSEMVTSNLSQESGTITLKATMKDSHMLPSFLRLLKKQLPNASIKLAQLSEKSTLLFTVTVTPLIKPGEISIKSIPFDFSTWSSKIAARAKEENLLIELTPIETTTQLTLQGSYANLMHFLFQLKQSQWPILLTEWQLKPYQKNLMLEAKLEVLHQ